MRTGCTQRNDWVGGHGPALLLLGLMAVGLGGCSKEQPSTVRVSNSVAIFKTVAGVDGNWSWDTARMGLVATSKKPTTNLDLSAFNTRELLVFDNDYTPQAGALPDVLCATLPGGPRTSPLPTSAAPPSVSTTVPFGASLVQLVDHGYCTSVFDWKTTFWKPVSDLFYSALKTSVTASFTIDHVDYEMQPFFSTDPADPFPNGQPLNGASMRIEFLTSRNCEFLGGFCQWTSKGSGDYALTLSNGFPKFTTAAYATSIEKNGPAKVSGIVLAFLTALLPPILPGLYTSDPEEALRLTFEQGLPGQMNDAMLQAASGTTKKTGKIGVPPALTGVTCNPMTPEAGAAFCASKQSPGPAKPSVRDFFKDLTAGRVATLMKISLPAAHVISDPIVSSLDPRGFWCDLRDDVSPLPEEDDRKGMCRWHPVFRRVNVMPDRVEFVWSNFGEPEPAEVTMVRWWTPAYAPRCATHILEPYLPTAAGPLPRFVTTKGG